MLQKKIVVAEDDDSVAHLVGAALGDAGFLCLRARDGEEALKVVRREAPDLLILDVMMPRVDGYEVAKKLKADVLASRIPILMLTALGAVNDRIKGLDVGADDYLAKPFDLRELNARVRALIRSSRRERDRNPTTHLPGSSAVEDHVDALLKTKAPCTVLHCDMNHFEAYTDQFGLHRAGDVVADLGKLILEQVRTCEGGAAFVGHVGGDDFVVVVDTHIAESLANSLIAAFNERVDAWYVAGAEMPPGQRVTLSIAVVDASKTGAKNAEELAPLLAHAKRTSKKRQGSNFVVWGS
jgi:diguanylate cyclase (GGDEF)-like protein